MGKLTYNKMGYMGKMGNSLFEVASCYGIAKRYNREFVLPEWKYRKYFKGNIPQIERLPLNTDEINEPSYSFTGWEYWDREMKKREKDEIVSIGGWLQSSAYFQEYLSEIKELFSFKQEFMDDIDNRFSHIFSKPVICITIRHGEDYFINGNYEILPILYYISALYKFFPDWKENYNVLICADDFEYAKLNLECHENIYFAESCIDIEQLYLATKATHYILANSTFSWWAAFLGQKPNSIVIHPDKYFKGFLAETHNTSTFWEKNWLPFPYRGKKFDLKDVTFTIPVHYDHKDRRENLQIILNFIHAHFDTNVIIGEQGSKVFHSLADVYNYRYMHFPNMKQFHRTKMLNDMAVMSPTAYIANYDADNLVPPLQLMLAIDALKEGVDMIYPYDGRCARVRREKWALKLEQETDCGILVKEQFRGTRAIDALSVGHIIIWNKQSFIDCGMENENFISYGPEDVERYERAEKLELSIKKIKGITYHIDHYTGENSSGSNPFFGKNYEELERIRNMSKEKLKEEVKSWKWMENILALQDGKEK